MLSLSGSLTSSWKKAATIGLAVASLGAVTLAAVEPAQAFRGGGSGFHRFGGGFGHGGFGGFRRFGGLGFRGGYGRFGYGGFRRYGWRGYGYRRFGWGYPALGFGVGYGLAAATYGYGYPYGGYGYGAGDPAYQPAGYGDEGYGRPSERRRGNDVCDPDGVQTSLSKRYCH